MTNDDDELNKSQISNFVIGKAFFFGSCENQTVVDTQQTLVLVFSQRKFCALPMKINIFSHESVGCFYSKLL